MNQLPTLGASLVKEFPHYFYLIRRELINITFTLIGTKINELRELIGRVFCYLIFESCHTIPLPLTMLLDILSNRKPYVGIILFYANCGRNTSSIME